MVRSSGRIHKRNKRSNAAKAVWIRRQNGNSSQKLDVEILPTNQVVVHSHETDFLEVDELINKVPGWCKKQYPASKSKPETSTPGVICDKEYESILNHELEVEVDKDPPKIEGYRIVDIGYVLKWAVSLQYSHSKVCTSSRLFIKEEKRRGKGLVSEIVFNCTGCQAELVFATEDPKKPVLNIGAVWGVMASGSTYTHMSEQLSCMNIPTMPKHFFQKLEEDLGEEWKKSLWRSMLAAGNKEKEHAREIGNVSDDGVPWITVYVDGSWSKRSYGTNYNSLSGMVGVIGKHTGQLLFVAVRNRYCSICKLAEKSETVSRTHVCYKNWDDAAPAMESDMAVEAFLCSETMHGVRYLKFIADGDSSVYAKLKQKVPYGKDIKKVECTNHALKNYGKRLYSIKRDTHISAMGRKFLTLKKIKLLQKRAKCSIYEHAKTDQSLQLLRLDLENGLNHVYGDHSSCREGICNSIGDQSNNKIPDLKASNIYYHLTGAVDLLVRKAHLLIENENNNRSERLMNIVARFNMGKRLNLVRRGSYQRRVYLSGLRHNSGFQWSRSSWKHLTNSSPGKYFKKFMDTSLADAETHRNKPKTKRRSFDNSPSETETPPNKKAKLVNHDYGPNAEDFEDDDVIEVEIQKLLEKLKVNENERNRIATESIGQFGNSVYEDERRLRLTASLFGQVINRLPHTLCHNLVSNALQKKNFYSEAVEYGISKEAVAIRHFESKSELSVLPSGLWVDLENSFLGASPDGLIGDNALIEVKSIYSARTFNANSIEDVIAQFKVLKKPFCLTKVGNRVQLKRNHPYYYQIQGQLNITQRDLCYFIVYINDAMDLYIEEIKRDVDLWTTVMLPKLSSFYKECIASEIIRDNIGKGLKCVDPKHILEARKKYEERKNTTSCHQAKAKAK